VTDLVGSAGLEHATCCL